MLAMLGILWLLSAALAGWAARAVWRRLRLVWAARYAREEDYDDLKTGTVALRGKVVPLDALEAPETGRPCVYVSLTVDRWKNTATMGGFSGQWIRMEAFEEAVPFRLTDGRHSVLVEPDGGRFHVQHTETGQRRQEDGSMIRFTEQIVSEGDEVLVVGQARQRGGFEPSEAYRGHSYRTVISAGEEELRVIRPPRAMSRRMLGLAASWTLAFLPFVVLSFFVASELLSRHLVSHYPWCGSSLLF